MPKNNFLHLHTHSHYSLLDGLSKIDGIIKRAKEEGMPAVALTDHGNMYGAIEFYKKCKAAGIKPIIGVETYVANRTRFDKEPNIDNKRHHLTLLAKNQTGYKNLMKIVTASHLEGFYYKPRIDKDLLSENCDGIICMSGCFAGEVSRLLRDGNEKEAEETAIFYRDLFGNENYYLEIMHHPGIEGLERVQQKILEIGKKNNIPVVATHDSHYLCTEDNNAHETLLAVQTGVDLADETRLSMASDDFSFIGVEKANELFKNNPETLENTLKVADKCNLEIELGKWHFPDFKVDPSTTHSVELRKKAYEGLEKKGIKKTKEVKDRIDYELEVIRKKNYCPYFLAVADMINYARDNGILTNTRGSAAASMVSYLIGITNLDPIEYRLPFERFLNPDRPSLPDIDMDFADSRRDEVIDYVREKYGKNHVAQIGTFGTMMARGVVRDVARALGYPYEVGDKISKLIPLGSQGFPMTIDRAMEIEPDLRKMYDTDEDVKKIIDLGKKLEGCVRHISVHAAGVVISPKPLTEYVPVQLDPKGGKIITQYDMHAVEDAGLPKFDFLGIRNLSTLADAAERVKKIRGIDVDVNNLPLDDKKTYQILARGETMGVFQLASSGMTRYLKELQPTNIHDINAMVALYRPGPMEFIPEYIRRKNNPSTIDYPHESMKKDLEHSLGLLIYQEDVMMTAIKLAGYSWLDADKFRKAMGKKIPELMAKQEDKFKEGCVKNGIEKKTAEDLWERIKPFASYAFNKGHSASYGRVAYQTAYMKANYPEEFMTALLTSESGDTEKIAEVINECKRMGYEVLPPDINESFSDFTIVLDDNKKITSKIRFGLRSIKNFGEEIGKAIIHERKEGGKYKSFSDFLERVQHRNLNKKSLEALIYSGAMDSLGERGRLFANIEDALSYSRELSQGDDGQVSLFGEMQEGVSAPGLRLKESEPMAINEKLNWEKELLGLYISGHPLEQYKDKFSKHEQTIEKIKKMPAGVSIIAAGIIDEVKKIFTKRGDSMAFVKITDFSGTMEVVFFSDVFEKNKDLLEVGKIIAIRGSVSHRNDEPGLIAERIKSLEEEQPDRQVAGN